MTSDNTLTAIRMESNRGVVYSNTFNSNGKNVEAVQFKPGLASSWTSDDTMGARDSTGESNVYIEDNTFIGLYLMALDFDDGSRVAVRHNVFDNSAVVAHGADTSPLGARHYEIYDNTFKFTNFGECTTGGSTLNLNWWVYLRGGTGIIADNLMPDIKSCVWGDKPELELIVQNLRRNAGPAACWTTYPAPHQVGQGYKTGAITDPLYVWGNSGGGQLSNPTLADYSPNECGAGAPSTATFVVSGRDYVTGTPKPGYTKFVYPHPFRQ
jgi:hypothetical protein